jgi:hypothetical protein
MDLMLDIETLSTKPNAVILSVGAVKFDPFSGRIDAEEGLDVKIDVDEQTALGRHVQDETLDWWAKQPEEVREAALGIDGRISIDQFTKVLNKMMVGVDQIWCQGPAFDMVIIEDLYRQIGKPTPWQFYQVRDSRTLFGVFGDPRDKYRKNAHNALMDCVYQAIGVQEIYAQQGVKPRFERK